MVRSLFKWFTIVAIPMATIYGFKHSHQPLNNRNPHPFYVSITELHHNQKENTLEISCKMFADDFENTLKTQYKTAIDIAKPKDIRQAEKLVYDYMQKHLQLKINGKSVTSQFVGFEKENESVWCYLQISSVTQLKKLEIANSLLYEMYDTQMGIIHAISGGVRKSTRVVYPNTNALIEW